jgi:hypothetical protein
VLLHVPVTTPFLLHKKPLPLGITLQTGTNEDGQADAWISIEADTGLGLTLEARVDAGAHDALLLEVVSSSTTAGIPLPGPPELANWLGDGGDQVINSVPETHRGNVTLNGIEISLMLSPLSVDYVGFSLSAPGTWSLFDGRLTIHDLEGDIVIQSPLSSAEVLITLASTLDLNDQGTAAISLDVSLTSGWGEQLPDGAIIDFDQVARVFVPTAGHLHLPQIQALALNYRVFPPSPPAWGLKVSAADGVAPPAASFGFSSALTLENMEVQLGDTGDGVTGVISGDITIAGLKEHGQYRRQPPARFAAFVADHDNRPLRARRLRDLRVHG